MQSAFCFLSPTNSQPFELRGISPFRETCQVELFTGVREKSYSPFISLNPIPFLFRTSLYSNLADLILFSSHLKRSPRILLRMQIE